MTLSPPGVAPVCNGGQLELTCTTAGRFLRWRFTVIRGNETITIIRTIQAAVPAGDAISHLTLNSTMFNFSRTSSEGSLPLTSKLVIGPVSSNLNGTVMNCIDLVSSNLSSTTIVVREREPLQSTYININHNYMIWKGTLFTHMAHRERTEAALVSTGVSMAGPRALEDYYLSRHVRYHCCMAMVRQPGRITELISNSPTIFVLIGVMLLAVVFLAQLRTNLDTHASCYQ